MKSTCHNLNNPLRIDTIEMFKKVDSTDFPNVLFINQYSYDLIQTKDPFTIYRITDAEDGRMYYGDTLIPKDKINCKYLVGPSNVPGEYILYMDKIDNYVDDLIIIATFDNPQKAINAMVRFNNIGNHTIIHKKIYDLLYNYIDNLISLHDLIISFISLFGYKDDPRLQKLIEIITMYDVSDNKSKNKDLPMTVKDRLPFIVKEVNNPLMNYYIDYYNIILKYNFFKDDKFNVSKSKLNLSDVIKEIIHVMYIDCYKVSAY